MAINALLKSFLTYAKVNHSLVNCFRMGKCILNVTNFFIDNTEVYNNDKTPHT